MIHSTFENINPQRKLPYPCLKIYSNIEHPDTAIVVLFTSESTGMVVASNIPDTEVGEYSITWDETDFLPYDGDVLLRNDERPECED
jgi:hypothetical protein